MRELDRGDVVPRSGVRGFSSSVLRRARRESDLRVDELARILGISQQAVALWESGKTTPTPAMLAALAKVLHVSTADLAPVREGDLRMGDLRAHAGLTQVQVAGHLGVSPAVVGNIERGLRDVNDDQVPALAELFDVSTDRLRTVWHQTYDAVTTRLAARD